MSKLDILNGAYRLNPKRKAFEANGAEGRYNLPEIGDVDFRKITLKQAENIVKRTGDKYLLKGKESKEKPEGPKE